VRTGVNTLLPYKENPPDLILKEDDIVFFDFGPVFEQWEADFGRTYVIGSDPRKLKLKHDIEEVWHKGAEYIKDNYDTLTGADVYAFTRKMAAAYGWDYTVEHSGHLIGNFPHEQLLGEERTNYLHPDNNVKLSVPDVNGNKRHWIYEVHLVDLEHQIGGFFEQLVRL
jgi:Xaa-Pro aminopeptidase